MHTLFGRRFSGRTAVVTGAGSGIGKAIALGLAAQGASVCLVGRRLEALESVAEKARADASQALCYQVDLTVDQDIQKLRQRLDDDFGHVDLLVHSAGVISLGKLEIAPVEDLDRQYYTNVRGPYLLTQTLLSMLKSRRGQIVFINSSVVLGAKAGAGQYAATKHALKAISDSLREEVNSEGVRVLTVFCGRTATPMQMAVCKMEDVPYHPERLLQPENVAAAVINALSLPRTAEVTEITVRPMAKIATASAETYRERARESSKGEP